MKKYILFVLLILAFNFSSNAQIQFDNFSRVVLNTYLREDIAIPTEAKILLITKLNQITNANGIAGSQVNPRFIITASVSLGTKDIIPGPPQMIAQNLNITLFVGDAISNTMFSSIGLNVQGVGTNDNKAFIEAIKNINPKNKEISLFLEDGKKKIISYYSTQCNFIQKEALALTKQEKYDEAIYQLLLVPNVCDECYLKCLDVLTHVYQQKIDSECKQTLQEAKKSWLLSSNKETALTIAEKISSISPLALCINEAKVFIEQVQKEVNLNEKEKKNIELKIYQDKVELEKQRIAACEKIALEYIKSYPKTITYNHIYWR